MNENTLAVASEPEVVALKQEASGIELRAAALVVSDVASHETALMIEKEAKGGEKAVHAKLDPICDAAFAAHKRTVAFRTEMLAPYLSAGKIAGSKAAAFEADQRGKARAEEARLAAIALREAQDRQLAEAIQTEAEGQAEEAEAILAEPVAAPVVYVAPVVAMIPGKSTATLYSADCHSIMDLVQFVYANPAFANLLEPNTMALNALARSQRELFKIPGCRLVITESRRTRI